MIFIKLFGFIALAYLFGKGFAASEQEKVEEVLKERDQDKRDLELAYDTFEMHKKALVATIRELQEEIRVLRNDLDAANYLLEIKKND